MGDSPKVDHSHEMEKTYLVEVTAVGGPTCLEEAKRFCVLLRSLGMDAGLAYRIVRLGAKDPLPEGLSNLPKGQTVAPSEVPPTPDVPSAPDVPLTPPTKPQRADRYNSGKLPWGELPPEIEELVRVYRHGKVKYPDIPGPDGVLPSPNWLLGMPWMECWESAQRHLWAWRKGEALDRESGLPHLAHAMWNTLTLLVYQERGLGNDDRTRVAAESALAGVDEETRRLAKLGVAGNLVHQNAGD